MKNEELISQYEFIQYTLFNMQKLVKQQGGLDHEIAHSSEEYYKIIRYHYLQNQVDLLKNYVEKNIHYHKSAFKKIAELMLFIMKAEIISVNLVQDYFRYFNSLDTSVEKGEGFLYIAAAVEFTKKYELAAENFYLAAAEFKALGFNAKYFSCQVAALSNEESKYSLADLVFKYECLYRECITLNQAYSAGIIQYNIAERFYENKKFEMAKRHLQFASLHTSKTEIPRTYYYVQILKCKVANEQNILFEVSSELEECLVCPYKEIQKEAQFLIDQLNKTYNKETPSLDKMIENYDLTPNEIKLLQNLFQGESDIAVLGEKIFGYLPDEKSLKNRINNLVSRIKKKTNLQIKKSHNSLKIA